jgi:ABC-type oligopeptide transport system ATPase subunit
MSGPDSHPEAPILRAENLTLGYRNGNEWTEVVHGISFSAQAQGILAIVGESGSGKSTVAKSIVKLVPIHSGELYYRDQPLGPLSKKAFLPYRKKIQMIFQDPSMALNPRRTVRDLLTEPLSIQFPALGPQERLRKIKKLLESVHLPTDCLDRFPAEFSGGQRQRILIARALSVEPEILVCDEPVSALDVSIQARLLDLLHSLKESHRLTLIFISHDLAVVQRFADEVIVMERGHIVESGSSSEVLNRPTHPYTQMLVDACPRW